MSQITFVPQQVIPFGPCPSDQSEMLKRIEHCGRVAYIREIAEQIHAYFLLLGMDAFEGE